ncbi:hypothetical protein JCM10914A_29220 [Paenibacillus sp. JCM 10914]|uniref:hypothetical protein n=1 Tax=Paenibacillus sp. JCM 10914 TaxID=1236974 RepID=UPI00055CE7AA|nr:hypothetical protein [Paenibacillus sp. JCM 10914]
MRIVQAFVSSIVLSVIVIAANIGIGSLYDWWRGEEIVIRFSQTRIMFFSALFIIFFIASYHQLKNRRA